MKDIKKPEFMKAALTARSHPAVLEMLIALLIFFVGSILMGVLQTPFLTVYLLKDQEYMSMIFSNSLDFNKIMNMMLAMPDWVMIANLFTEIAFIIIVILYCRLLEKRKLVTMGFRKKGMAVEYLRGIALGAAAFGMAYGICVLTGSTVFHIVSSKGTTWLYILGFFFGYLVQGMAEEVICRGYLLVSLSRRYSVTASVILSAVFFAMLHGLNAGVGFLAFLNLALFGIFMGLLFVRYENIWVVGAVHSIWNFVQGNIFGISVSGNKIQPSLFTSDMVKGREFIHGGMFGAEGGLAVTIVLLFATALLIWNMSKEGYFIPAKPVINPYDNVLYGSFINQNMDQNQNNYTGQDGIHNQNNNTGSNIGQNGNVFGENPNIFGSQNSPEQPAFSKAYENMGVNPEETPWHPKEEQEEKSMTAFDQNYFKD